MESCRGPNVLVYGASGFVLPLTGHTIPSANGPIVTGSTFGNASWARAFEQANMAIRQDQRTNAAVETKRSMM